MNKKNIFFLLFFVILILVNISNLRSFYYNYKGEKAYTNEDYENAINTFSKSNDLSSIYNIANSYYKKKDYENAIKYFTITTNSPDKNLIFKSLNNLGNSYYRYGKLDEETRLEKYLNSVSFYEKALEIKKDEETEKNRDFVLERIKELQKKEEEKDKKQQESGENPQGENNDNGNENGQAGENENNNENDEGNSLGKDNYELNDSQKAELEEYKKALNEMQSTYSEGFNKIYKEINSDFGENSFLENFFQDSIKQNEKDW